MSWKRFILFSLLGLVVVLGLAVAWLWNADLGRFEPTIEDQLASRLGAEVRFEDLVIELGPELSIRGRGLTVDNPAWHPEARVLSVASFDLFIGLRSLFDAGPIQVLEANVSGVRLDVSRNAEGASNLDFPGAEAEGEEAEAGPPVPLLIRQGRLEDARLEFRDADRDAPVLADIQALDLSIREDGQVVIDLAGAVNEQDIRYDGHLGPFSALVAAGRVEFEGLGRFGTLDLEGSGVIDRLSAPDRPELQLIASGPDIRDVERLLGLTPGRAGAYRLEVRSAVDEQWTFSIAGHVGDARLDLEGATGGLQSLDPIRLDLAAEGPDLAGPLRLLGMAGAPNQPFQVRGRLARAGEQLDAEDVTLVIGDTELDLSASMTQFPHFRDARVSLQVAGPDVAAFRGLLKLPGIAEGPFRAELDVQPVPAGLDLVKGHLETALGTLDLSGTISEAEGYVGSEATLRLAGDDAGQILSVAGVEGFEGQAFVLEAELVVDDDHLQISSARLEGLLAAVLEASGDIGFEPLGPKTAVQLRLRGEDLATTVGDRGVDWPLGSGAFDLSARLDPEPGGVRIEGLEGKVGRSSLQAQGLIPLEADLAGLDLTLSSEGPSLENLLADTVQLDVPAVAWRVATRLRRVDDRFRIEDLEGGVARIGFEGALDLPWPPDGTAGRFNLQAQGPDLAGALPRVLAFQPAAAPFELSVSGDLADGYWRFEPSHLTLLDARVDLEGRFHRLPDFDDTDLKLSARAPDLSTLGAWNEQPLPAVPLRFDSHLTGSHTDLSFDTLRLESGDSSLEGRVRYSIAAETPYLDLDLASPYLDLRGVMPPPEDVDESTPPEAEPGEPPADGRLIPDWPLPLERLEVLDADVTVAIEELVMHRRIINDLEIEAGLQDGALTIERYHSLGRSGNLEAGGGLTPLGDGRADITFWLRTRDFVLDREAWREADPATLPRFNVHLDWRAQGADLRALAASLDGKFSVVGSEGQLPGTGLGALNLGLMQQMATILVPGYSLDQPTELRCFAVNLEARQGLVSAEPMAALSTNRLLVQSTGTINLADESMNLGFKSTPTKLLSLNFAEMLNPFVRIRGTMAAPQVELDPAGTLVYGGAAAATGGLSILAKGLWDRIRGSEKPCEGLRTELQSAWPSDDPPPVQ